MKKFTFFLFLFFSVFCFAQNRDTKTGPRTQNTALVKPVNTAHQNPARQNSAVVQQRPVVNSSSNNIVYQRPANPNNISYQRENNSVASVSYQREEQHKVPLAQPAVVPAQREQKPTLQREQNLHKVPLNRETKPNKEVNLATKKPRPAPRPGNYHVIYWTNFIEPAVVQQEWATKVLDTKNLTLDGRGVQVAILDSGIKPHRQFDGASIEVLDITGQNDPFDFCGHGTAVAGIIVGQRNNDFKGVAPAVNLKSYKIADESGTTNNTYIINALESILEYNRQNPAKKINIINISYGLEQDNYELRNKLAEAYSNGITIISASGNEGREGLLYPAKYDFVFAAGSIDRDKTLSDFSNWGKELDFILPGSGLKTLGLNNDYVWVRGTSFSSAYLTGIAALATQAFKNKYGYLPSPQDLYEIMQKISTPVKTIAPIKQGYGVPDASKIVSYI